MVRAWSWIRREWSKAPMRFHLVMILGIMSVGTMVYYSEHIPVIEGIHRAMPIHFAWYSTHRILSILPVAYAAFVFGLRGGVMACGAATLLLLPSIPLEEGAPEIITDIAAFFVIGLLVSWLIDAQGREKQRRGQAIAELETTQEELLSSLETTKKNERHLSALNAISTVLSESLALERILDMAVEKVLEVTETDAGLIYLLNEGSGELEAFAYRGVSLDFVKGADRLKIGEGFNGRVALTGEPLMVQDSAVDARLTRDVVRDERFQAQLIVPLKAEGKVVGTLAVATRQHRDFLDDEMALLVGIGNQIGMAVENAHLDQEQRRALQQLRRSEKRYRDLFDQAGDAILVLGADGGITAANQACTTLTGYTLEELTAMRIKSLFPDGYLRAPGEMIETYLREDAAPQAFETHLKRKDGGEATVEVTTSIVSGDAEPLGLQAIVRDVTEQRQLQENMRFYVKQITRVQEEERKRLARELHDDTAQSLVSIGRGLDDLVSRHKLSKEASKEAEELQELTEEVLQRVRSFSRSLRPSILDDLGLMPALTGLVKELKQEHGIDASLNVEGRPQRLSPAVEVALYRIAQESLNNVVWHSKATSVDVRVEFTKQNVKICIKDNGEGFDLPNRVSDFASRGHFGLLGIHERVKLLGGNLTLQSKVGDGTTVTVEVPKLVPTA
jgi:PAS domain S-box-containing protein